MFDVELTTITHRNSQRNYARFVLYQTKFEFTLDQRCVDVLVCMINKLL